MSQQNNSSSSDKPDVDDIEKSELVTSDSIMKNEASKDEVRSLFETNHVKLDVKRLAVISDIHSNQVAFKAILKDMKDRDFDAVVCLGDLVGYYTKPNECVSEVIQISDLTVMGNHDFAIIEPEDLIFNSLHKAAQEALLHNKDIITDSHVNWIKKLPIKLEVETPYGTITMVHGDPLTIFGYIYGSTPEKFEKAIQDALQNINTDYLFVGHSHIQGEYYDVSGKIYVNPGAVGQPRDGDPRAAYAIVDLENRNNELIRVDYDRTKVKQDVIACCLPEQLANRLDKGL